MRCARASELAGIECESWNVSEHGRAGERKTVCYAILRLYLAPHTLGLHEGRLRGGHVHTPPHLAIIDMDGSAADEDRTTRHN